MLKSKNERADMQNDMESKEVDITPWLWVVGLAFVVMAFYGWASGGWEEGYRQEEAKQKVRNQEVRESLQRSSNWTEEERRKAEDDLRRNQRQGRPPFTSY